MLVTFCLDDCYIVLLTILTLSSIHSPHIVNIFMQIPQPIYFTDVRNLKRTIPVNLLCHWKTQWFSFLEWSSDFLEWDSYFDLSVFPYFCPVFLLHSSTLSPSMSSSNSIFSVVSPFLPTEHNFCSRCVCIRFYLYPP